MTKPTGNGRGVKLTEMPCPRCLALAQSGQLRAEAVQRLPPNPWAPSARDKSGRCCFDCASADAVMSFVGGMTFEMARIAVGNDRQEQYRLPGAPMGLVRERLVRPSKPGDLEDQHAWLDSMRWFGLSE